MLHQLTEWLIGWAQRGFLAFVDALRDFIVWLVDTVGGAIVSVLSSISLPSFMATAFGDAWGAMPAGVIYVADKLGIPGCLAIIGAAVVARIIRRFATLGIW